jgi:hypothetical protein
LAKLIFLPDQLMGVRTLKLLNDERYPTTFDEDELRAFVSAHIEFFYIGQGTTDAPRRPFVDILWPLMDEFLSIWRQTRSTDYWAAGEAMAESLRKAKVAAPVWPRKETAAPERRSRDKELDDEIPF